MLFGLAGFSCCGLFLFLIRFLQWSLNLSETPQFVYFITPEYDAYLFLSLLLLFLFSFPIYGHENLTGEAVMPSTGTLPRITQIVNHVNEMEQKQQVCAVQIENGHWISDGQPPKETKTVIIASLMETNVVPPNYSDHSALRKQLDQIIYGFCDIKDAIFNNSLPLNNCKKPILIIGPEGCGKESFCRSLAKVLLREFIPIRLLNVSNPVERIIRRIKWSKSTNPIVFLEDVNTLVTERNDNPTGALIEMFQLSPAFYNLYPDETFDLSDILFILSASSSVGIARRLYEKVDCYGISEYQFEEKISIAQYYLIPKIHTDLRLTDNYLRFDEQTLRDIAIIYISDAGIQNFYQSLDFIMKKAAVVFAGNPSSPVIIDEDFMENVCQTPVRLRAIKTFETLTSPGVAAGLFGSGVGGVSYVETAKCNGIGNENITGQVDSIMRESAMVAISWLKSNAWRFGIPIHKDSFENINIHVHFPSGAVPKGGPSAGLLIAIALLSLFTNSCVRSDTAITGEITLSGLVLPVGCIPVKIMAAIKNGFARLILPSENFNDVKKLPKEIKEKIEIIYIHKIEEVVELALVELPSEKSVIEIEM